MVVKCGTKTWRFPDKQIRSWDLNGNISYQNIHPDFIERRPKKADKIIPDNPNDFYLNRGVYLNKNGTSYRIVINYKKYPKMWSFKIKGIKKFIRILNPKQKLIDSPKQGKPAKVSIQTTQSDARKHLIKIVENGAEVTELKSIKEFNVIIRTSGRPNYFSKCIKSIRDNINISKIKLHITIDDPKDIKYVLNNVNGLDYTYYIIDKAAVEKTCRSIKISRTRFIYNYYFNIVKHYLNGWCFILDDDDKLMRTPMIKGDLSEIYLHKVNIAGSIVPNDFGKPPRLNDMSSLCIIFHSSQMIDWVPNRGGDYDFISALYKKYKPVWNNVVLSGTQTSGNNGRRNDLKS